MNPATWKGNRVHLLSRHKKLGRGHHAAMPFDRVAEFIGVLRQQTAIAALALEFLILTAARSGEVLGACWDEIDLDTRLPECQLASHSGPLKAVFPIVATHLAKNIISCPQPCMSLCCVELCNY